MPFCSRPVRFAAVALIALFVACADNSGDGIPCQAGHDCVEMLVLPGPCWRAVCRDGQCVPAPLADGEPCVPSDPCLRDGVCRDELCIKATSRCDDGHHCTHPICDPETETCSYELDDSACDDSDPCTVGRCTLDGCRFERREGIRCDDSDPCTVETYCTEEGCVGRPVRCPDYGPCVESSCDPATGACLALNRSAGAPCPHPCHEHGECDGHGHCLGLGAPISCGVPRDCHRFECTAARGCEEVAAPDGTPCPGAGRCELWGVCRDGGCVDAALVVCDDFNPCTVGACHPDQGCLFEPLVDGTGCDDGDPCTVATHCSGGLCLGSPRECDDQNPCTASVCDPLTGECVHLPRAEGTPCDDSNPCTHETRCRLDDHDRLVCRGVPKPDGVVCDDSDLCTIATECRAGECVGVEVTCDDGNDCTAGWCDHEGVCRFDALEDGLDCGIDNPCAKDGGICEGGECRQEYLPSGSPCDRGLACVGPGQCNQEGRCEGPERDCSSPEPCLTGYCLEPHGCLYDRLPDGALCDDSDPCTVDAVCHEGRCGGGRPVYDCCSTDADCDDGWPFSRGTCRLDTFTCDRAPADQCNQTDWPIGRLAIPHALTLTCPWRDLSNDTVVYEYGFERSPGCHSGVALGHGVRGWPPHGFEVSSGPSHDGRHALALVGAQDLEPGWDPERTLDLPPLPLFKGTATFSFRYRLALPPGEAGPESALEVLVNQEVVRVVRAPTGESFALVEVPIYSAAPGQLDVRLRWRGGPGDLLIDTLRYRLHAACTAAHTSPPTSGAMPEPDGILNLAPTPGGGRLVWRSVVRPAESGRLLLQIYSAPIDSAGWPSAPTLVVDDELYSLGGHLRVSCDLPPLATGPAGRYLLCPLARRGRLECVLGDTHQDLHPADLIFNNSSSDSSPPLGMSWAMTFGEDRGLAVIFNVDVPNRFAYLDSYRFTIDDAVPTISTARITRIPMANTNIVSPRLLPLEGRNRLVYLAQVADPEDPDRPISNEIRSALVDDTGSISIDYEVIACTAPHLCAAHEPMAILPPLAAAAIPDEDMLLLAWVELLPRAEGGRHSRVRLATISRASEPEAEIELATLDAGHGRLVRAPSLAVAPTGELMAAWTSAEFQGEVDGEPLYRADTALRRFFPGDEPLGPGHFLPGPEISGERLLSDHPEIRSTPTAPAPAVAVSDTGHFVVARAADAERLAIHSLGVGCGGYLGRLDEPDALHVCTGPEWRTLPLPCDTEGER